jgi:hypothetical protein
LLAAPAGRLVDGAFRKAVLARTQGVLRRRGWARRAGLAAALAACYAAGLATMRLAIPAATGGEGMARQAPGATSPQPTPLPTPKSAPTPRPPEPDRAPTALALEWQAVDSPVRRPELFRTAGDRYLTENGDLQSATRCYRSFLDLCSERDRIVSVDDTWLLMALKEGRQREKRRADSNA